MANFKSFEDAIKTYLDKLSKTDELFAKTYSKKGKNIKECCNYIMGEAKKAAKGGTSIALSGEEVYALAIHYYDEDDISAPDEVAGEVVAPAKTEKPSKPKTSKRKKVAKPEPVVEPQAEVEEAEEDYELVIPVF